MKCYLNKHFFLYVLLLFFVLSSCSIQKRLYMPGYDVDWNSCKDVSSKKKRQKELSVYGTHSKIDFEQVIYNNEPIKISEYTLVNEENYIASVEESQFLIIKNEGNTFETYNENSFPEKNEIVSDVNEIDNSVKKNNYPSIEVFSLIGLVVGVVGIMGGVTSLFSPLVWGILALAFGGIGLYKIKYLPEKFIGKPIAITCIVLGIIGIVLGIVL